MARFTHPAIFDGGLNNLALPHGQFLSLQTQSATVPNVMQAVMFETPIFSQGVTVENGDWGYPSRITFEHAGIYNVQFSGQLHHLTGGGGGSGSSIRMWFRQNGINIPNSNTSLTIASGNYLVAAWNIFVSVEAGDYIELVGYPMTTDIILEYIPAIPGDGPAIPSMILTVNQVA